MRVTLFGVDVLYAIVTAAILPAPLKGENLNHNVCALFFVLLKCFTGLSVVKSASTSCWIPWG